MQNPQETQASEHVGRPTVQHTDYGHTMILCPFGHLVQSVAAADWAGSFLQARIADSDYTVTCHGTIGQQDA